LVLKQHIKDLEEKKWANNGSLFLEVLSLRLGHGSALTVHRTVIHSLAAASLPSRGRHYLISKSITWVFSVLYVSPGKTG
jgi:hypothetical protein